jgi:hypothetical protein
MVDMSTLHESITRPNAPLIGGINVNDPFHHSRSYQLDGYQFKGIHFSGFV